MSDETKTDVFYFSNKNGQRVRVERKEWEKEWLDWWRRTTVKQTKEELKQAD